MILSTSIPLLALAFPLLALLAGAMLLPSLVHAAARPFAARTTLGAMLLAMFFAGAVLHVPDLDLTPAHCVLMALCALSTMLIAAPLLGRGRTAGTMISASTGGLAALASAAYALDYFPALIKATLLPATLLVAVLLGFAGSALLPMSPLRHDARGALRNLPNHTGTRLAGWGLLCLALLFTARFLNPALPLLPVLACAIASGLLTLFTTRAERAMATLGEAFCAGLLLALPAGFTPETAILAGVIAAFVVARSDAITQALHLDDPLRAVGAVLLPLTLGLLMPGLLDFSVAALATQLRLLGFILAAAALISVILWPITMIFVGLALPAPLARYGVRP
ncbi:MAG: hypothetical protein ACKVOE_09690 [Rickettsiales bacterium]